MGEHDALIWGSSGRRFKSCQPDQYYRWSAAILADRSESQTGTPGGYVTQPVTQRLFAAQQRWLTPVMMLAGIMRA
jgi:hypothetical protein